MTFLSNLSSVWVRRFSSSHREAAAKFERRTNNTFEPVEGWILGTSPRMTPLLVKHFVNSIRYSQSAYTRVSSSGLSRGSISPHVPASNLHSGGISQGSP